MSISTDKRHILEMIRRLVSALLVVAFASGAQARAVDDETRRQIVEGIVQALDATYVFPDTATEMGELLSSKLAAGGYAAIADLGPFTEALTADLQSVSHDKHLRVRELPPAAAPETDTTAVRPRVSPAERARQANYGFAALRRLPGNVGYLDLRFFADAEIQGARATAVAAMNFLASCDALVIDLRRNSGGSPSMIQLLSSYLLEGKVHLNTFYIRATDRHQEFWTHEEVEGERMIDVPVYVLTSGFTFSAAEEFTYNLKNLNRAKIVGETTGGGAHPVTMRRFPKLGIEVSVPFGRAINPITGTNWEGTGVAPDLELPQEEALRIAHHHAVGTLLERFGTEAPTALEWVHEALGREETSLDEAAQQKYVGTYGDETIFLRTGSLWYRHISRPARRLLYLGGEIFCFEELEDRRLEFRSPADGASTLLVSVYPDGRQRVATRTGD